MTIESEKPVDNLHENDMPKRDVHFAKTLAATLDKSVEALDDVSLAKLKKSRAQALAHASVSTRHWVPISVAASILMLVAIPALWQKGDVNFIEGADIEAVFQDMSSQDIPYAAQEMDDMEMLIAMDDTDA